LYLTGWLEPESVAVIAKEGEGESGDYKFWMFVRGKDKKAELWDGARSGVDAARDVWNADEACLPSLYQLPKNGRYRTKHSLTE
jgi:intermediate cleaving peptidase 55